METNRQPWASVLKLALIISIAAAVVAIALSTAGEIPQAAIVLPVIIIAFTVSWVQTGRPQRREVPVRAAMTHRRAAPTA